MNIIDKLIEELCPEGLEYKGIENLINSRSIITISPPKKLTKNHYKSAGRYPIIDQGQDFIVGYTDNKELTLNNGLYVVFGDHTEVFKFIDFSFAQGADGIKILKTNIETILTKYLYYALTKYYIKTGKYTRHYSFLKKTLIPVPPIPIQQEIVNILDKFTSLDVELQAELEARNKQYEYYRNQLLNFEGKEVEWKMLGEVCDLSIGQKPNEDITQNGKFPFINAGIEPSGYLNAINSIENTITIPSRGAGGAGHVGYQRNKFWCGPLCYKINSKQNFLLTKYLYNYLKKIQNEIVELRQTGSIPAINRKELVKVQVPIPPLSDQQHIVSILDKFEELVNSGLPAEIEARRKQYEYYREKLLTFNKVEQIA